MTDRLRLNIGEKVTCPRCGEWKPPAKEGPHKGMFCEDCALAERYNFEEPVDPADQPKPDWATDEEWAEMQSKLEWRTATENQGAWEDESKESGDDADTSD